MARITVEDCLRVENNRFSLVILAAKRAGITDIILCADNEKDIKDIKSEYLKGLKFHYVSKMGEVIDIALLREKVKNPLNFTISQLERKETV